MSWFTTVIIAVSLLSDSFSQQPKTDSEVILGTWRVVSLHIDGSEQPTNGELTFSFEKGKLIAKVKGKADGEPKSYTLDPSKNPKWIDVTGSEESFKGIYELDGDSLKMCHSAANSGHRPTKFASEKDSPNKHLAVFKRDRNPGR